MFLAKPLHSDQQTQQGRKAQWRKKKLKEFCSKLVTRNKRGKNKQLFLVMTNMDQWSSYSFFIPLSLYYHPPSLFQLDPTVSKIPSSLTLLLNWVSLILAEVARQHDWWNTHQAAWWLYFLVSRWEIWIEFHEVSTLQFCFIPVSV